MASRSSCSTAKRRSTGRQGARRRSRKQARLFSGREKLLIVLMGAFLAFVVLMTISAQLEKPFLPTWDELLGTDTSRQEISDDWQMHVIDVGNADSILITDHKNALLIDAGERGDGDTVREYLKDQGIEKLDYVIATHFHEDHIGGMTDVIDGVAIGEFLLAYMPEEATPTTNVYADMLEALLDKQVPVRDVRAGDRFMVGEASLEILGPVGESDDMNNQSVVCRVTCGGTRFLLTGDAEIPAENQLLVSGQDLSADVLKLGHHGSNTASSEAFLRAVAPRYSVMTCGSGNSYGHPHKEVLSLIKKLGIENYRCDKQGHIVFTTDGEHITVITEK